jgi:uncharacterized protein
MEENTGIIFPYLYSLTITLLGAGIVNWIAWASGFYQIPLHKDDSKGSYIFFRDVLGVFAFFLFINTFLVPYFWIVFKTGSWKIHSMPLSKDEQEWFNIFSIFASALGVLIYCLLIESRIIQAVLGTSSSKSILHILKNLALGALTWVLAYPLVISVNQFLHMLFHIFFGIKQIDQVAVRYVKMTLTHPSLFFITAAEIVLIVPLVEEVLFRGFLQTWMRQKWGIKRSIFFTSLIFACFHFSYSQGWNNIELIVSLFLLACFLGFLYERQRSIWAPVGLHMMFNGISILMIIWQEGIA